MDNFPKSLAKYMRKLRFPTKETKITTGTQSTNLPIVDTKLRSRTTILPPPPNKPGDHVFAGSYLS